jgi:hypothetical protein
MTRKYKFTTSAELILDHLKEFGPATTRDLVGETGKAHDAVRKAVNRLHAERRIFVKDWPYTGRQRAKLWALRTSSQMDCPQPPARNVTELKREWARRNTAILKMRRSVNAARGNPFAALISQG